MDFRDDYVYEPSMDPDVVIVDPRFDTIQTEAYSAYMKKKKRLILFHFITTSLSVTVIKK